jgi:Zn-finger nucleic acid-binding protein
MPVVTCPDCAGAMESSGRTPDLIWSCSECGGIWLERAALQRAGASLPETLPRDRRDRRRLSCPLCAGDMQAASLPECNVDVCLLCGGLYLDAGELELLKDAYPRRRGHGPVATEGFRVSDAALGNGALGDVLGGLLEVLMEFF